MKNFIYHLPVALLLSYVGFCFYRPPQVADSLIVLAVAGLHGFLMYIKSFREIPLPEKSDKEKEYESQIRELRMLREVEGLKVDLTRVQNVKKVTDDGKAFHF